MKSLNQRNHKEHMEGIKHAKRLKDKAKAAKDKDKDKASGSNDKVVKQKNGENKVLQKWKCSLCGVRTFFIQIVSLPPYCCSRAATQDTRASKGLLEEHYQKRHMQRMPRPPGQGPGPPGARASPEPPPTGRPQWL